MPDDANGNFSLIGGYLAVTGETIQPSQHNPPLEDIASALTARLLRSGVAPMTGPLKTITGSKTSPAIYPNSNPSIGIYWTATGIAFAGTVAGVRFIGELIEWTRLTAAPLTVFPYGQTLLRASYPDLWTAAQTEIAAGNTFYNNGDGSTTFGIGDLRGRVIAGKDDMGGTAAGRLTTAAGGVDGATLGASGGGQSVTLVQGNLPALSLAVDIPAGQGQHHHPYTRGSQDAVGGAGFASQNPGYGKIYPGDSTGDATLPQMSGTAALGGSSTPFALTQPTFVCNYLLYAGA